jgi:hypothetical protein
MSRSNKRLRFQEAKASELEDRTLSHRTSFYPYNVARAATAAAGREGEQRRGTGRRGEVGAPLTPPRVRAAHKYLRPSLLRRDASERWIGVVPRRPSPYLESDAPYLRGCERERIACHPSHPSHRIASCFSLTFYATNSAEEKAAAAAAAEAASSYLSHHFTPIPARHGIIRRIAPLPRLSHHPPPREQQQRRVIEA